MLVEEEKLTENLGQVIKKYRRQLKISQDNLSYGSQIDRTYLSRIEKGRANPSISVLLRIAKMLNVKLSQILQEAELINYNP